MTPAFAQDAPQIQIFVPAAPGGGWDQTARTMEQVLRTEKLISPSQITNVGGAGGTVGLPQFVNQWKGQAERADGRRPGDGRRHHRQQVARSSSPQTTPIARLTGEFEALVVPANSPFKTAKDFVAALKADPEQGVRSRAARRAAPTTSCSA